MGDDEQEMKCQECGERRATVHLTDFVDGKAVQKHLCEECYGKKDGMPPLTTTGVFAQILNSLAPELAKVGSRECPDCGINYLEFRQTLMLGCPRDYEVFAEPLDDLLERIQGARSHVGKMPRGAAQSGLRGPRLQVLRRELDEVVKKENFEKAAALRDEIRELEQDGAGGPEEQTG